MRRSDVIIIGLVFSIILVTIMANPIHVFAFNKDGSTPIPGNLFPHPSIPNNNNILNHVSGTALNSDNHRV